MPTYANRGPGLVGIPGGLLRLVHAVVVVVVFIVPILILLVPEGLGALAGVIRRRAHAATARGPSRRRAGIGWLVRTALTALGGAWVKLGQVAGQQPRFVGNAVAVALRQLQDGGRRRSPRAVRRRLVRIDGFAGTLTGLTWIASASNADVFCASWNGTMVAVKATRWTARLAYRLDHALMYGVAWLLTPLSYLPFLRVLRDLQIPQTIRNLADGYLAQVDLRNEARHAETLRRHFLPTFNGLATRRHPELTIAIPQLHHHDRDVIVMEWAAGTSARTILDEAYAADADTRAAAIATYRRHAETVIEAAVFMTLRQDVGHGDMHAGNLRFDGERIWLLDYGLVFEMGVLKRLRLCAALLSIAASDAEGVARQLALISPVMVRHTPTQRASFVASIAALVDEVQTTVGAGRGAAEGLPVGHLLERMMGSLRKHRVAPDPAFGLIDQNLLASQGFLGALAPDYDLLGRVRDESVDFYRALVAGGGGHIARVLLLPSMLALAERGLETEALAELIADVERQLAGIHRRTSVASLAEVEREVAVLEGDDFKALHLALLRLRLLADNAIVRGALARQHDLVDQRFGQLRIHDLLGYLRPGHGLTV